MRLIDADVLYRKTAEWEEEARKIVSEASDDFNWLRWSTILHERSAFKFDVEDAPTINAEPVKHGYWEEDMGGCWCSCCDDVSDFSYTYCPHCGAKMDGRKEDG